MILNTLTQFKTRKFQNAFYITLITGTLWYFILLLGQFPIRLPLSQEVSEFIFCGMAGLSSGVAFYFCQNWIDQFQKKITSNQLKNIRAQQIIETLVLEKEQSHFKVAIELEVLIGPYTEEIVQINSGNAVSIPKKILELKINQPNQLAEDQLFYLKKYADFHQQQITQIDLSEDNAIENHPSITRVLKHIQRHPNTEQIIIIRGQWCDQSSTGEKHNIPWAVRLHANPPRNDRFFSENTPKPPKISPMLLLDAYEKYCKQYKQLGKVGHFFAVVKQSLPYLINTDENGNQYKNPEL